MRTLLLLGHDDNVSLKSTVEELKRLQHRLNMQHEIVVGPIAVPQIDDDWATWPRSHTSVDRSADRTE